MTLVVGLGLRAECDLASLQEALHAALEAARRQRGYPFTLAHLSLLATPSDKTQHSAVQQLAAALQLPIAAIPLAQLAAQSAAGSSAHVPQRYGNHSVAEAAALAAAGPGANLLGPRCVSPDRKATAAIASKENNRP